MKIKKSIIDSIRTSGGFSVSNLINHTDQMNQRIGENLRINEEKIAQGIKQVQEIQIM